jgi:hypothetical protein
MSVLWSPNSEIDPSWVRTAIWLLSIIIDNLWAIVTVIIFFSFLTFVRASWTWRIWRNAVGRFVSKMKESIMTTRYSAPRCHYRLFLFLCRTQELLPTTRIDRVVASDSSVSAKEENAVGRCKSIMTVRAACSLSLFFIFTSSDTLRF